MLKINIKCAFFILIGFLHSFISWAVRPITAPQITNYNSEIYKGGTQNWDITQDKKGIIYVANNDGLLTFNGRYWNVYKTPNLTSVRSVKVQGDKIYVGAQDEFGYFMPNEHGILKYHSLIQLIPKQYRRFADVWSIAFYSDGVLFRSKSFIFYYKDQTIKVFEPPVEWEYMVQVKNRVLAHSKKLGLVYFDGNEWEQFGKEPVLAQSVISSVIHLKNDEYLISTLKDGFFFLNKAGLTAKQTEINTSENRVYTGIRIDDTHFAYGTTSGGIYIINIAGKILNRYSYNEGLQSNNNRALLLDKGKNLWIAQNDGIDYIAINSAVKPIFPDQSKRVSSYVIKYFQGSLYIGTSNGIYTAKLNTGSLADLSLSYGDFKYIQGSEGQVWNLKQVDDKLLVAHEDGGFYLKEDKIIPIYNGIGTWNLNECEKTEDIIAATYFGLRRIGKGQGVFIDKGTIPGLEESFRFLVLEQEYLWGSHPYRGVYRLSVDYKENKVSVYKIYNKQSGLPSSLYNYVYEIDDRALIATEKGVYQYNDARDVFEPYPRLEVLKNIAVQYLKQDTEGNIWFVSNRKVGVVDFSNTPTIYYFPQLDNKVVGGFEHIYALNKDNIFIAGNKGIYHVNYQKYQQNIVKPDVLIHRIKVPSRNDSLVFGGYNDFIAENYTFKNDFNSLHFEYASTLYDHIESIEYSYLLEGLDNEWSAWSNKSEKDYTNLSSGKYVFKVKSRNGIDNESEVASYTFIILPKWYQTKAMYVVYVLLLICLFYSGYKYQERRHKKAHEKLSYLHQLELDRNEKEIVRLKNEKLESEIDFKNRELSSMTMNLVQRGKVLSKIKDVISTLAENKELAGNSTSLRHLIRLIKEVEKENQDWDNFALHFNNVNSDFFNKLKDKFPDLTPNELKLCAFIKMNLSSKEIAQLMNITIKAVEVGRYRLRKKLQISSETNLYDFLIQVVK